MKFFKKYFYNTFYFIILLTYSCDDGEEIIITPVSAASEIQVKDLFNVGNASDIEISFTKAEKEINLLEYRAIIVSTEDNSVLNVESASKLSNEFYQTIAITGNDIKVRLEPDVKTLAGQMLVEEQFYIVYILSVSNGQETNFNQLSTPSVSFKFSKKSDIARNLFLMDVGNSKNSSDLRLSFFKARAEERVSSYRVILVKSTNAADFTVDEAENLGVIQYKEVLANGEDKVIDVGFNILDSDGDEIVEGRAYKALILSIEDGVLALNKDLSRPSNELILKNASYVKTLSEEFQGTGGLSYHPSGYLISGNTSGFFNTEKGLGTYKISLDGIFELQTTNLESCKGSEYHPGEMAILQATKNGFYSVFEDGSTSPFGGSGSITDIAVAQDGSFHSSICIPPSLWKHEFDIELGVYLPKIVGFNNDDGAISCIRYIEVDGNGVPIIMNYNDNKVYKIKIPDQDRPPELHAELPIGENFTSIVFVNSRSSIFATTSQRRVIQIHEFKSTLTTLAGQGNSAIVDGSLESSSFINPVNITASTDGNTLYILDEVNNDEGIVVLRKIELVD